jgi:signal transduction histidine kinase/ActR/RegA family two-component response regulator
MAHRLIRFLGLLPLLALLLGAVPAAAMAEPVAVTRALFSGAPDEPAHGVTLPDTWRERGRPTTGAGHYRLGFHLSQVPPEGLALRFSRVSSTREVILNGQRLAHESRAGNEHARPDVIDLPVSVLRAGDNTVDLLVRYRNGGGLSDATLDSPAAQALAHDREVLWNRELPRSMNMAMMALSLVMLLVWWRRPSESTNGLFGLLASIGSLRNYTYFSEVTVLPNSLTDWLFFSAQVWTIALFTAFARGLLLERGHGRVTGRLLLAGAVLVPAAAALALPLGGMPIMRMVTYPVLLVLGVVAAGVLWRAARQRRDVTHYTLATAFSAVIAAGLHDHLFQQGFLPVTGTFWVPYMMPFAFGVYSVMAMSRMISAVGEVERLNVELEQRVLQRTRALQVANATKSRFLASASHDLRQPVAAIGLMVSLLREHLTTPPLRTMVDRVDEAVASMETMLRGLLDLSRLESGSVRARPEHVVLQPLFDAIALHEAEAADRKGLRLRLRATSLAVFADRVLLDQVLRNLVSNALRYTERGGVLVTARSRGPKDVLIQVWDTGVGISPEDQAVVFEEFVQVGNLARQRIRGLGLGLSIVQRSAAVMGHALTLRSVPGRGTCFGLVVPRATGVERAASVAHPAAETAHPLAGLRVVLVDDDAAVRESLAARLAAWGADVRSFDGVAALRAALPLPGSPERHRFTDLLITDQRLPGGSGLLVIELVRQRCGATRAMVVTGDTSPGDLTLLEASGVPVLHKPFRAEALLATVRQALASTAIGELAS